MKRYVKAESFDDSIAIYYKHDKLMEGDIESAYNQLCEILEKDTETKDSVIDYLNSFGDPLISEEEYDDVGHIADMLVKSIALELSQDYYDETEFLDNFYIDDIKNLEIFPAKQQIVSATQIPKVPEMTVSEFLGNFDFDYEVTQSEEFNEPCWQLIDLQDAYLGNIGTDEFFDVEGIVDRLDIYYDDYLMDGDWVADWGETLKEISEADPRDWRIPYIYYIVHPNELTIDKPLSK